MCYYWRILKYSVSQVHRMESQNPLPAAAIGPQFIKSSGSSALKLPVVL